MNQRRSRFPFTSRTWTSAILLAGLTACAGPVRQGDVDWTEFDQKVDAGNEKDAEIADERKSMEFERRERATKVGADERFLEEGRDALSGDVAERWRKTQAIERRVDADRSARDEAARKVKNLDVDRADAWADNKRELGVWLEDAWHTTRKGALNLRVNYAVGASTNSQIDLTGTVTHSNGTTDPFSGFLTGDGLSTDSSEFGVEYYLREGLAVEGGISISTVVRNDEAIDHATLSYDDEGHVGMYFGLKYCFAPVQADGTGLASGRMRPFANLRLGFMDNYDLNGTVSIPASDPLNMKMNGDSYSTLGVGGGVIYAWTDHIQLELGINHIQSLSDVDGTWNFTGSGAGGDDYQGAYTTDISTSRVYFGITYGF